jgi:small subunit ribosomal protein S20
MHTKSAKKRLRQSLERRERNRSTRSALKTQIKKVREAVKGGDLAQADAEARVAAKKLDLAAAKKIIHKNAAARTKSRISRFVKASKQKAAAPKA